MSVREESILQTKYIRRIVAKPPTQYLTEWDGALVPPVARLVCSSLLISRVVMRNKQVVLNRAVHRHYVSAVALC